MHHTIYACLNGSSPAVDGIRRRVPTETVPHGPWCAHTNRDTARESLASWNSGVDVCVCVCEITQHDRPGVCSVVYSVPCWLSCAVLNTVDDKHDDNTGIVLTVPLSREHP